MKKEIKIRVEDYNKHDEVHDKIIQILNEAGISYYNAIGILETIKQEIFLESEEED